MASKLVGQNYVTPDLVAKVTGQSEVRRGLQGRRDALLPGCCSARCRTRASRNIDISAALAMPGVKGDPAADEIPAPADIVTDLGQTIKANTQGEKALTERAGLPGRAGAGGRGGRRAHGASKPSRRSTSTGSRCRSTSIRSIACGPADRTRALEGNIWVPPGRRRRASRRAAAIEEVKWTEADFAEYEQGRLPMGKPTDEWTYGDVDAGFKNAALVLDETFVTPNTSHQTLEPRTAMAYWQNGKLYLHCSTQSTIQTVASSPLAASRADRHRAHQRVHGRRIRQQGDRHHHVDHSGAALEEGERAGA